jgi:hypothetical protein
MRWLVYLTVALLLLATGLGIYSSMQATEHPAPAIARPAEPGPTKRAAAPAPLAPPQGALTVEAEGLTLWQKQALGEGFRKLISDAIHEAISKSAEDLYRKLGIADDMESKLVGAVNTWDPQPKPDGPFVLAFYLIRPGKSDQAPATVEVTAGEGYTIQYTRAFAAVDRPLAVMTLTNSNSGRLTQREQFLVYGPDNEWRATPPKRTTETLGKKGK